jgi:hypothetical protein
MNAQAQALRTALVQQQRRTKDLEQNVKQSEEDRGRLTVWPCASRRQKHSAPLTRHCLHSGAQAQIDHCRASDQHTPRCRHEYSIRLPWLRMLWKALLRRNSVPCLQTELSVAKGEVAQRNTELSMLRADHEALVRSKNATTSRLEGEFAELQSKVADLLADKAIAQNRICSLEHDKCQLCVQVRERMLPTTTCTLSASDAVLVHSRWHSSPTLVLVAQRMLICRQSLERDSQAHCWRRADRDGAAGPPRKR